MAQEESVCPRCGLGISFHERQGNAIVNVGGQKCIEDIAALTKWLSQFGELVRETVRDAYAEYADDDWRRMGE